MSHMDKFREFHTAFGIGKDDKDKNLRPKLIFEEANESMDALRYGTREEMAKELADLVYVAYGAAEVYDIDLDAAIETVHASNMSKVWSDGKVHRREDGKILKPDNYVAPDMSGSLLETETSDEDEEQEGPSEAPQ